MDTVRNGTCSDCLTTPSKVRAVSQSIFAVREKNIFKPRHSYLNYPFETKKTGKKSYFVRSFPSGKSFAVAKWLKFDHPYGDYPKLALLAYFRCLFFLA